MEVWENIVNLVLFLNSAVIFLAILTGIVLLGIWIYDKRILKNASRRNWARNVTRLRQILDKRKIDRFVREIQKVFYHQ